MLKSLKTLLQRERKSFAAAPIVSLQTVGRPQWSPRNYAAQAKEGFGANAIGYRCVRMIAEAASTVPLLTYVKAEEQGGSAAEMRATLPVGAKFILLNAAVVQPDLTLAEALSPTLWRVGPAQLDQSHGSYIEINSAAAGRALRPLSPARLTCTRQGADLMFSWIRRTRIDGDSWDLAEVPLGEAEERYRLSIGTGTATVRAVDVVSPSYLYTAAELAADFAIPPTSLTVSVAQISAAIGAGTMTQGTFNV